MRLEHGMQNVFSLNHNILDYSDEYGVTNWLNAREFKVFCSSRQATCCKNLYKQLVIITDSIKDGKQVQCSQVGQYLHRGASLLLLLTAR